MSIVPDGNRVTLADTKVDVDRSIASETKVSGKVQSVYHHPLLLLWAV